MSPVKIFLDESDIPRHWYNVVADLPIRPRPRSGRPAFRNGDSGPLWILNNNDGTLNEFVPSQTMSSGSPTPKVSLSNTSSHAYQITFGPARGQRAWRFSPFRRGTGLILDRENRA